MNNKLYVNPYQFEQLLQLEPIKDNYTYYTQNFSDFKDGVNICNCNKRWIKYAGIEFIEMFEEDK